MNIQDYTLPDFEEILSLEKKSFKEGSGISYESLIGKWKFCNVWKKGERKVDNISSSLLQVLSANLELSKKEFEGEFPSFEIRNSISFGLISINFSGKAFLKGSRPLLTFNFEKLLLKLASMKIFETPLKEQEIKKMPFFSLIAMDQNTHWMCARGKGGGIAIWVKD